MNLKEYKNIIIFFMRLFRLAPKHAILITILRVLTTMVPIIRLLNITYIINTIQLVVDRTKSGEVLWIPIVLLLAIEFVGGICSVFLQELARGAVLYLNETQYPNLIKQVGKLEYFCFEDKETLDLITRIKKNYVVKSVSAFTTTLYFVETILIALSIVITLSTEVGLWALSILIVSIPLIIAGQKSGKDLYQGEVDVEKHQRYLDYIEDIYTNRDFASERQLFKVPKMLDNIWDKTFIIVEDLNHRLKRKNYIRMCISNIISYAGYAVVIGILCIFLINKSISYGFFISIVITILRLMYTLSYTLTSYIAEMSRIKNFANDYYMFLELPTKNEADIRQSNSSSIAFNDLEFNNVTFKYPNTEKIILENLNFKLEKYKRYAFVGENGAGKSTITKLLLGLYEVGAGRITINGQDIKEYKYSDLKSLFSVAFQDYSKYEITVKDSVALGVDITNDAEVISALKFVGLDSMFQKYNDFLDKELGKLSEDSMELSGGQWQRLAVARTVLSNHSILVLDEVTAAIDPIQESEIYGLFEKTSRDKTTIFITHRLGATKFVDCIFVIGNGGVLEQGTHDELMKLDGKYANMYREQSRWYE